MPRTSAARHFFAFKTPSRMDEFWSKLEVKWQSREMLPCFLKHDKCRTSIQVFQSIIWGNMVEAKCGFSF